MEEGNLEPDIIKTTGVLEQNEQDFTTYLNDKTPEVVLAVRDSMAVSFMNIAQKRGISVPEQLQVIGFQNTRYSELSYPKLTCVDIPIYDIGSTAMSELTKLMKEDVEVKPTNVTVDYKIVWRNSTK
jgi:LacI family transcriptional regulator